MRYPLRTAVSVFALLLLEALSLSTADAQSFNCRYAKGADEILICQDPRLSELDTRMASVYFQVRNRLPPAEQAMLNSEQQSWLRARASCGRDANCIAFAYDRRIAQLTSMETGSRAQDSSPGPLWFVANTSPPDAYLALRTAPSSRFGQRIAMLPNGTLLQVLQRRPDGWWLVRAVATGQQGWALSGQGSRTWIECCQAPSSTQTTSNAETPQQTSSSSESSGTGFFVAPHLVLTNNHVIKGCGSYPITVAYPDRRPVRAFIAGQDNTNDLVLLQTELPNDSVASFRFGPRVGEQVAAYGFPLLGLLSTSGNFTLGNVTSLAGIKDDTRVLQTSTPVQPGNSGGPLLDMYGSVVGVVEEQLDALAMLKVTSNIPQNVNFAIQAPIVINFLSIKGVSPNLAANERKTLEPADVANLAEKFTVQVVCQPTTTAQ